MDFHKRFSKKISTGEEDYRISKWYTFGWGVFCIIVAMFAHNIGNSLIEAVNILGSLFYGVILGIFLLAFYFKKVKANAVFWSAVIVESFIISWAIWPWYNIGFLWLNAIGAIGVVLLAILFNLFIGHKKRVMINS